MLTTIEACRAAYDEYRRQFVMSPDGILGSKSGKPLALIFGIHGNFKFEVPENARDEITAIRLRCLDSRMAHMDRP